VQQSRLALFGGDGAGVGAAVTHVSAIFPVAKLYQMIEAKLVREQVHPTIPLRIFNYTEKCAYDKLWNDVTINCRGLILDASNNIVARPWKKFFNYGEGRLAIDDIMPVEVTDKMDGSLGILYPVDSWREYGIATRGSFASDQALHATKVWNERYSLLTTAPLEYTFLFEIVYPSNRIVLDYKDMDDLVLLGAVHIERGYYLGPLHAAGVLAWPGPVTTVFPAKNMAEAFAMPPRANAEGVVVRSGTEMVKIKQVDYVELHRIVTNLTPRTVWTHLKNDGKIEELIEMVPDEWHDYLKKTAQKITEDYANLDAEVISEFLDIVGKTRGDGDTRKAFALEATKSKHSKYMFNMYDMKPVSRMIWEDIKPKVERKD